MNLRVIYEKCFQLPFKLFLLVLEESLVGRHRLHELVLVVLEVALHLGTQKDDNYTIFYKGHYSMVYCPWSQATLTKNERGKQKIRKIIRKHALKYKKTLNIKSLLSLDKTL